MGIVVLGATGGSGRAITVELAERGHEVTAVSRCGDAPADAAVRTAAADLYDPVATRAVCAGADVVVLAAMPPYHAWHGNFERMTVTGCRRTPDAQLRLSTPPARARCAGHWPSGSAAFSRQAREGRKVAHQFDRHWVVDATAFETAFGPIPLTDHRDAFAATLDWLRGQASARSPTPSGEDHAEPGRDWCAA